MKPADTEKRPQATHPSLPHEVDRRANQPYAKEVEDYGEGVASPPPRDPEHPPRVEKTGGDAGKVRP